MYQKEFYMFSLHSLFHFFFFLIFSTINIYYLQKIYYEIYLIIICYLCPKIKPSTAKMKSQYIVDPI